MDNNVISGMSKSKFKKYLYQRFESIFKPELEKRGFIYKYGAFHRKLGVMYQSIGVTFVPKGATADVYFSVYPFWANDQVFYDDYNVYHVYDRTRNTTHGWTERWNMLDPADPCFAAGVSDTYIFNEIEHEDPLIRRSGGGRKKLYLNGVTELLEMAVGYYVDNILPLLDSISTEEEYVSALCKSDITMYSFRPLPIVYESAVFERPSMEFLKEIYDSLYKKAYILYLTSAKMEWYEKGLILRDPNYDHEKKNKTRLWLDENYPDIEPTEKLIKETNSMLGKKLVKVYETGDFSALNYIPFVKAELAEYQRKYFGCMLGLDFSEERLNIVSKVK